MSATTSSPGYALLIGVDDYSTYDASVNASAGDTNSLRGSVNDVRAWYRLCRELGYPAENIRVLASPEIPRPELEGATVGPATADAIREGVAWLADKLGAPDKPAGVLSFSGHGGMSGKGLMLGPTDVKADGDDLVNVVYLLEIQATIASRNAGRNLTAVLDCCHAPSGDGGGGDRKVTALRGRAVPAGRQIVVPAIGDRTFFASELGAPAYQSELGGRWRGAFTWAFMTVRDQWPIVDTPDGNKVLSISNEEMRSRTAALLAALDFEQQPALRCTPNAGGLPVFNRGPDAAPGTTSDAPDAERTRVQLDGGCKGYRVYTIQYSTNSGFSSPTNVGQVLVPNTTGTVGTITYSPGTEYWYLSNNVSTTTKGYLKFAWVDYDWTTTPTVGTQSFTMAQNPAWTYYGMSGPPSGYSNFVRNGQYQVTVIWGLTLSGTTWSGSLQWYDVTGANTVFGGTSSSTTSVVLENHITTSVSWYKATSYPL